MANPGWVNQLSRVLGSALGRAVTGAVSGAAGGAVKRRRRAGSSESATAGSRRGGSGTSRGPEPEGDRAPYPGDFVGVPSITYDPHPGDPADPGEVVWTWVPYEEDHRQGKDRPVLVIGRDEPWLLALPLTSQDHDRDEQQEALAGRYWYDIGTGPWDARGRPSEVRLDRILRVDREGVRRTGAALDRAVFERVADEVRAHH